jgi:hypothetical protein
MIPSIKIFINSKPYLTDSISEVANVVDTLKQKMYDIKDIVPVKGPVTGGNTLDNGTDYWNGIVVYWFVKDNKRKIEEEVYKTTNATNLLNTLEQKRLWQKGEVKVTVN